MSLKPALAQKRDIGAARLDLVKDGSDFREYRRGADGAPVVVYRQRDRTGSETVTRALTEWLDWLLHRDLITREMWEAGDSLRETHHIAFGSGYATANLDGTSSGAGPSSASNRLGDARHRYMRIREVLQAHDPLGWAVAEGVCCHGISSKEAARRFGARGRDGAAALRVALLDLDQWLKKGQMPQKSKPAH